MRPIVTLVFPKILSKKLFITGFVCYKSVLVNVENLKEQVARNETARLKTEEKLTELKEELGKFDTSIFCR